MSTSYSSRILSEAAKLAERIQSLETQLARLLKGVDTAPALPNTENGPVKTPRAVRQKRNPVTVPSSSRRGRRRTAAAEAVPAVLSEPVASSSPRARGSRGALGLAVVQILKESVKPLKVAEIYDALVLKGYPFSGKDPKKILGVRIYKLKGVVKAGQPRDGLFQAAA